MAKDLDLSGLDDIYTDKEGNKKSVDTSGLEDIYSPKESKDGDKPFYAKPILPPGTARDVVTGVGAMIPGVHQVGAAGDVINAALSGQLDPTDLDAVKAVYEKGRQKVGKAENQAVVNSPVASRVGEGVGLLGSAAALPASLAGGAAYGAASAALGGNTPIVAGNAQDLKNAAKETAMGGALGLGAGLGGKLVGKGVESVLSSPAAKAFLAASKGAKLTGPGAVDEAGQALLNANDQASQGVEALRKQIGAARDAIENSQTNKSVDLSDSLTNMIKRFENLTGNERVEAEKAGLLDLAKPKAPFTEITPITKEIPAIPGTKEKLAAQGELAVQKEAALGNDASYDIIPGKDSQGKDTLSLVIRKRSAPTNSGESLVPSEGGAVENEMQKMAEDQGLEQPKIESEPENYINENISVKPQYNEPGSPASKEVSFQPGEEVANRQPLNSQMSVRDALDLRQKLRAMSQDPDLHPMVRQAARDGLGYLQSDLSAQLPELKDNDASYAALKNAQKLFGKKYNTQDQLIQSTKQGNLLQRSSQDTLSGVSAKQQLANAMNEVRKVSPDLADKMQQSLGSSLENFNLAKTAHAPDINMTSLGQSINKSGAWIGAKAGETAHSVMNNPVMRASKTLYSASDDALKAFSQKLSSSGGDTGKMLGKALDQALNNKNQMSKNAIIFSIMQNPMLRNMVGTGEEEGQP